MSQLPAAVERRAITVEAIGSVLLVLGSGLLALTAIGGAYLWADLEDTNLSTAGKLEILLGPILTAVVFCLVLAGMGAAMRLLAAYTVERTTVPGGPAPARPPVAGAAPVGRPRLPGWFDLVVALAGAGVLVLVVLIILAAKN